MDYIDVVMSQLTYESLFGLQMDTNNNIKMQGKKIFAILSIIYTEQQFYF